MRKTCVMPYACSVSAMYSEPFCIFSMDMTVSSCRWLRVAGYLAVGSMPSQVSTLPPSSLNQVAVTFFSSV